MGSSSAGSSELRTLAGAGPRYHRLLEATAAFLVLSALLAPGAMAQSGPGSSPAFRWGFDDDTQPGRASVRTCESMNIGIYGVGNDTGVPPFYMISWEIGGTPQTTLLGSSLQRNPYTVKHSPGSKLIFNVVDSDGKGGGIPPQDFDVVAGSSTDCVVPKATKPKFTITSNVTFESRLMTCDPWGLTIKGGTPPYYLNIARQGSDTVTNVTIESGYDAYTYINRAEPSGLLMAAISDSQGVWASGTPLVRTDGSEDRTCLGRNSMPGNATLLGHPAEDIDEDDNDDDDDNASGGLPLGAIIGIAAGGGALLILLAGLAFWCNRRKRRHARERTVGKAGACIDPAPALYDPPYHATPYEMNTGASTTMGGAMPSPSPRGTEFGEYYRDGHGTPAQTLSTYTSSDSRPYLPAGATHGRNTSAMPLMVTNNDNNNNYYSDPYQVPYGNERGVSMYSASASTSNFTGTTASASGLPPGAGYGHRSKGSEAREEAARAALLAVSSQPGYAQGSGSSAALPVGPDGVVIQHRDGGAAPSVTELPPPYWDRLGQ